MCWRVGLDFLTYIYKNKNNLVLCLVQFQKAIYVFFICFVFTSEDIAHTQQTQKEHAEQIDCLKIEMTKTKGKRYLSLN